MDVYDFIRESFPLLIKIKNDSIILNKSNTFQTHSILNLMRNYIYNDEESLISTISLWKSQTNTYSIVHELSYTTGGSRLFLKLRITSEYIFITTEDYNQINEFKVPISEFEELITNKELFILTYYRINIPFIDLFDEYKNEILKDIKMIARRNDYD